MILTNLIYGTIIYLCVFFLILGGYRSTRKQHKKKIPGRAAVIVILLWPVSFPLGIAWILITKLGKWTEGK